MYNINCVIKNEIKNEVFNAEKLVYKNPSC